MAIEELRMPRDAPPGTRPPVEMITPRWNPCTPVVEASRTPAPGVLDQRRGNASGRRSC